MNLDRIIAIVHDKRRFQELPREHYQAIAEATLQAEVEIVTPTSLVSPSQVDAYVANWAAEVASLRRELEAYMAKDPVVIAQRAAAKAYADAPVAPPEPRVPPGFAVNAHAAPAPIVPPVLADIEKHDEPAAEPAPSPAQAETVALEQKPAAPAPVIGAVVG